MHFVLNFLFFWQNFFHSAKKAHRKNNKHILCAFVADIFGSGLSRLGFMNAKISL